MAKPKITAVDRKAFEEVLADLTGSVGDRILYLAGRILGAEKRIAELEKCPLDWRGVYEEGVTYPARSIVSFAGSMWYTPTKTKARPNEGAPWKLVVKRGADAK
jgi:hypothetical protein